MAIEVESLSKSFGAQRVIAEVSEIFREAEISILLGPSGCGKTTTLRCIAGLEQPSSGTIKLGGRPVFRREPPLEVPVEKRGVSMVFQSYAIWPHMSVFGNVALPLKAARCPRAEIARRVGEALDMVGLSAFADRSATQLSGGQQQRVALARCIVSDSPYILMDEPLSNLDAKLRVAMRSEIRELQRRLGRTILFVTHDREEAMSIGDQIFLYRDGAVLRRGSPEEVYDDPRTRFAAEFLGGANILSGWSPVDPGQGPAAAFPGGYMLPLPEAALPPGGALICVRPERWRVEAPESPGTIPGRVTGKSFVGDRTELTLDTPIGTLTALERGDRTRQVGEMVALALDAAAVRFVAEP